jgi:hypothetical protein
MSDYFTFGKCGLLATEAGTSDAAFEKQAMGAFSRTAELTGMLFEEPEFYRGPADMEAFHTTGDMPPLPPGPDTLLFAHAYFRHPGSV